MEHVNSQEKNPCLHVWSDLSFHITNRGNYRQCVCGAVITDDLLSEQFKNGIHDGKQLKLWEFTKLLQMHKKQTAPNSGAGRLIKELLRSIE